MRKGLANVSNINWFYNHNKPHHSINMSICYGIFDAVSASWHKAYLFKTNIKTNINDFVRLMLMGEAIRCCKWICHSSIKPTFFKVYINEITFTTIKFNWIYATGILSHIAYQLIFPWCRTYASLNWIMIGLVRHQATIQTMVTYHRCNAK